MFTVPPFAAGTVLRLRRETADQLALRVEELEEERELFTEIALRHERARIASELHDIVGHAISVMVIQAAAGQRLVDSDPARAKEAFAAISESARQGTEDLEQLIELLGGSADDIVGGPDLSLVDEVVTRAARSGLNVSCRFEGDRDRVAAPVAHLAFRVVQESLTNALRYAPGSEVRIVISVDETERSLAVRVENDDTRARRHDSGRDRARPGRTPRAHPDTRGPVRRWADPPRRVGRRSTPPERLSAPTAKHRGATLRPQSCRYNSSICCPRAGNCVRDCSTDWPLLRTAILPTPLHQKVQSDPARRKDWKRAAGKALRPEAPANALVPRWGCGPLTPPVKARPLLVGR